MTYLDSCKFVPWLLPQVENLFHGKIGCLVGGIKIEHPVSGAPLQADSSRNDLVNDMFTVAIPVAGEVFRWQFIFDGNDPSCLPDILLDEEEEFDPDYGKLMRDSKWISTDNQSLLRVVQTLIRGYKEYHLQKCSKIESEKLWKDIEILYEEWPENYVETSVKEMDQGGLVTNVLIRVDVDFSKILDKYRDELPPPDAMIDAPLLLIKFEENSRPNPLLYLPSHVEHALGGKGTIPLPSYNSAKNIADYVKKIQDHLSESTQVLCESHSKRCDYIAAFIRQFAGDVLEYDSTNFSKIHLMFNYQDFYFLVHISLSRFFPRDAPKMTFQSSYHMDKHNQLFQIKLSNYPYSPRWSGVEMAKRAKSFIHEKASIFKDNCLKHGVV